MARKWLLFFDYFLPVLRVLLRAGKRAKIRKFCAVAVAVLLLSLLLHSQVMARPGDALVQRGRQLYDAGQFARAAQVWENAASSSAAQGDELHQAIALCNLSTALQELGEWDKAKSAIAQSLQLIGDRADTDSTAWLRVLAQALNTRGSLELTVGDPRAALNLWEQATDAYRHAGDEAGVYRACLNQSLALQSLGLYQRALDTLEGLNQRLQSQPISEMKVTTLRALGNTLRLLGDLPQSEAVLRESFSLAQQLRSPKAISETAIALGNTARARNNPAAAYEFYQQAAIAAQSPATQVQARLNALSLILEEPSDTFARDYLPQAITWLPQIQAQLEQLPPSRMAVFAQIKFAQNLLRFPDKLPTTLIGNQTQIAQLLAQSVRLSRQLNDKRAESYALGNLAAVYETKQQWAEAQQLTEEALALSEGINAVDIAYRWEWQLGRLLKAQGKVSGAIAAYAQAVESLEALRLDLVTANREIQFSFRDRVEPVYREFVSLLLQPGKNAKPTQKNLRQALQVMESLKLAELDNFFRDACVDSQPVELDKQILDPNAAIFYPIILGDRLEVVVSLPGQPLRHYSHPNLSQEKVEETLINLRKTLVTRTSRNFLTYAETIYQWVIEPFATDLADSGVETLVFLPDGLFRNVPMAALYDGEQFLIEKYGIALSPGLKLIDPQPLEMQELEALTAGISQERFGFSQLPNVVVEVERVSSTLSGVVLLDEAFTRNALQEEIIQTPFPVVHIATHGQFSSNAEETFILAWDERINVNQLDTLLRVRDRTGNPRAIELLVLSACQTATGDNRAALGLAGMAVRAGARSTLATLWFIDDAATVPLMGEFYRQLNQSQVTKAQALRTAQLELLQTRQYRHPIYWAPYVLVGNWL
ncbi:CHAT domain-containing protein [Phormidium sp. CCY1219]|uniref:CHAT domain-containing protein n=1 Tax=Phormidium sp. CCY1219 TaxID=2886104 RepID=UPI002D1E90DA|nr:CHAT domain-containing protein [Phormidium sp. CCY1219]MEB3828394.1 CHAT domain-containing protein [Phormidium sp. CCY1219]